MSSQNETAPEESDKRADRIVRLWIAVGAIGAVACVVVAYLGRNCGLDEQGLGTGDACHPKYTLAKLLFLPCLGLMTVGILAVRGAQKEASSSVR